jgi:hypothetical protein
VGVILRYAVTADLSWLDLQTAGLNLMLVGAAGLALGLFLLVRGRSADIPPPAL